jgi:TP53 regulating kinase-like protein
MESVKLLAKGAEADILLDSDWNGISVIIKRRGVKKYRNPELDKVIRRSRTIREASMIHKAKEAGVPTPIIFQVNPVEATIVMEHIEGEKVRDVVDHLKPFERIELFRAIGEKAGLLHEAGIIHGDLTTSNIIISNGRVVFIDFGLSEVSDETEKRGVDLNLMYRMLTSTHFKYTNELFEAFKAGYKARCVNASEALERMDAIAKRGRYVERN